MCDGISFNCDSKHVPVLFEQNPLACKCDVQLDMFNNVLCPPSWHPRSNASPLYDTPSHSKSFCIIGYPTLASERPCSRKLLTTEPRGGGRNFSTLEAPSCSISNRRNPRSRAHPLMSLLSILYECVCVGADGCVCVMNVCRDGTGMPSNPAR